MSEDDRPATDRGSDSGPASESGDVKFGGAGIDTSKPASEADAPDFAEELKEESGGATNSWPGAGGPGTIPPPG
jgi:hypothetical protein